MASVLRILNIDRYNYDLWIVFSWWLVVFSLILITNYINIIINGVDRILYLVATVLISFFLLQKYEIIEIGEFFAPVFNLSLISPISSLIFIPIIILSYYLSFNFFKQKFYLDSDSKKKVEINVLWKKKNCILLMQGFKNQNGKNLDIFLN